jgi:ABC-type amino acid transport substrate-binding protein
VFNLDVYGGAIATRVDNDEINTLADLKDKIIGAGAIIDLMGGQMQIYEMEKKGMSYVNDPKQMIFMKDQDLVVQAILSGRVDVGFIRTNQIELTMDENGNPIDPELFKIIEPKVHMLYVKGRRTALSLFGLITSLYAAHLNLVLCSTIRSQ